MRRTWRRDSQTGTARGRPTRTVRTPEGWPPAQHGARWPRACGPRPSSPPLSAVPPFLWEALADHSSWPTCPAPHLLFSRLRAFKCPSPRVLFKAARPACTPQCLTAQHASHDTSLPSLRPTTPHCPACTPRRLAQPQQLLSLQSAPRPSGDPGTGQPGSSGRGSHSSGSFCRRASGVTGRLWVGPGRAVPGEEAGRSQTQRGWPGRSPALWAPGWTASPRRSLRGGTA